MVLALSVAGLSGCSDSKDTKPVAIPVLTDTRRYTPPSAPPSASPAAQSKAGAASSPSASPSATPTPTARRTAAVATPIPGEPKPPTNKVRIPANMYPGPIDQTLRAATEKVVYQYFDAVNAAVRDASAMPAWTKLIHPRCLRCLSERDAVKSVHDDGQHYEGGEYRIVSVEPASGYDRGGGAYFVVYYVTAGRILDRNGSIVESVPQSELVLALVSVDRDNKRQPWRIGGLTDWDKVK